MKKQIALTLSVAMAVTALAGCGGSGSSSSSSAASATAEGASESSGRPTITFMIPTFYGTEFANDNSDKVIQAYEDYTNTTVEWRLEANDTYKDKFGLTLMDKDNMPMILTASGALDANIVDAAKKGAFWDLSSYLQDSESYPNLSQANENVLKGLTVDGQIIGIPRTRAIGRYGLAYRTDWAEAVGITEPPKTIEDVYNMLYAFTYDDRTATAWTTPTARAVQVHRTSGRDPDLVRLRQRVGRAGRQTGPVHQTAEYKEACSGCARSMRTVWSAPTGRPWTLPTSRLTPRRASPASLSTRWTAASASGNT